jgi:hypothetical protein
MRTHENRAELRSSTVCPNVTPSTADYASGSPVRLAEWKVGYRNLRKSRLRRARSNSTSPTVAIPAP